MPDGPISLEFAQGPETKRVERQPFKPGTYWRCKRKGKFERYETKKGEIYLLLRLVFAFNELHSFEFLYPPSEKSDEKFPVHIDELEKYFEVVDNGEAVRSGQLKELQDRLNDLRERLVDFSTNPDKLMAEVQPDYQKWLLKNKWDGGTAIMPHAGLSEKNITPATLIEHGANAETFALVRGEAAKMGKLAELTRDVIQSTTTEMGDLVGEIGYFMMERAHVGLATTSQIADRMAGLMKGIESLDLYLGKNVVVETLRKGKSAPATEKLCILQSKLFMDEELAVWADVDERFDHRDQNEFLELLLKDDRLLNQVLPTQRCVAVMAVRRNGINYEDPWEDASRNQKNLMVFMLVRDGENLHIVDSPVSSHMNADRLFPLRNEQNEIFCGFDGSAINFEDIYFARRASRSENLTLHYKRFLILVCGLDHRVSLFGRFYPEEEKYGFMTEEFQARYFTMLASDELSLPEKIRGDWSDLRKRQEQKLSTGSRLLVFGSEIISSSTASGAFNHPTYQKQEQVAFPINVYDVALAFRDKDQYFVELPVERKSYGDIKKTNFNAKVTLKSEQNHYSEIGYLVLDGLRSEDLIHYVMDRTARAEHTNYIRAFKSAAALLKKEEEGDAASIQYLVTCLHEGGHFVDSENAELKNAILTWKRNNRWAPLPISGDLKGMEPILNMAHAALNRDQLKERAQAFAEKHGVKPVRLVARGKQIFRLYTEAVEEERDAILLDWVWCRAYSLTLNKSGFSGGDYSLRNLAREADKETLICDWPTAANWQDRAPADYTIEETRNHIERVRLTGEEFKKVNLSRRGGLPDQLFAEWLKSARLVTRNSRKWVSTPLIALPVGIGRKEDKLVRIIVLWGTFYRFVEWFGSEEQSKAVRKLITETYHNPTHQIEHLELIEKFEWRLGSMRTAAMGIIHPENLVHSFSSNTWGEDKDDKTVLGRLEKVYSRTEKGTLRYWICPEYPEQKDGWDFTPILGSEAAVMNE